MKMFSHSIFDQLLLLFDIVSEQELDLTKHMHQMRPTSKWHPFLLTNIRLDVFHTDFPDFGARFCSENPCFGVHTQKPSWCPRMNCVFPLFDLSRRRAGASFGRPVACLGCQF